MMHFINKILEAKNGVVTCRFNNEEIRKIEVLDFLISRNMLEIGIIFKLKNEKYFNNISLDSYGTLSWNNEIDFCPDVLFSESTLLKIHL